MCHLSKVQHWTTANESPQSPPHRNINTLFNKEMFMCFLYLQLGRNTKSSNRESVSAVSKLQEKKENSYMKTSIRFLIVCHCHAQTNMYTHDNRAVVCTLYWFYFNKELYAKIVRSCHNLEIGLRGRNNDSLVTKVNLLWALWTWKHKSSLSSNRSEECGALQKLVHNVPSTHSSSVFLWFLCFTIYAWSHKCVFLGIMWCAVKTLSFL